MSLAEKLEKAEATGKQGDYIEVGKHLLEVRRIIEIDGHKGHSIVAEFDVLSTSNERDHYEGQHVSDVHKVNKSIQVNNLKAFVLELFRATDVYEQYQEADDSTRLQMIEAVYSGDGTQFQGVKIFCEGKETTTREGNPFTRLQYEEYDPEVHDAQIEAHREHLDNKFADDPSTGAPDESGDNGDDGGGGFDGDFDIPN